MPNILQLKLRYFLQEKLDSENYKSRIKMSLHSWQEKLRDIQTSKKQEPKCQPDFVVSQIYPSENIQIMRPRLWALKRIKVKPNNKSKPLFNNDQKFIIFNI